MPLKRELVKHLCLQANMKRDLIKLLQQAHISGQRFMGNPIHSNPPEGGQAPTFAFWKNLCFNNSEDVGLEKEHGQK